MNSSLTNHTKNALQKQKRKKRWQKVLSVLAAVVVFVTTYMLILPAITLEKGDLICTIEEHTHTEECYTANEETGEKELVCTIEEHTHKDDCYSVKDESDENSVLLLDNSTSSNLHVTKLSGEGTTYDPVTDTFTTKVKIEFEFTTETGKPVAGTTYTYTYPSGIEIPDDVITKGEQTLYDGDKQAGTYQFIKNDDGTYSVQIIFASSYIASAGETVTGYVQFAGSFNKEDMNEKGDIVVGVDDATILVPGNEIEYPKDETESYNIDVSKSGSWVQDGDQLVYTVYVRTTKGTPDSIDFSDTITIPEGLSLGDPIIKVEKGTSYYYKQWYNTWKPDAQNGWSEVTGIQYEYADGKIDMSLPALLAEKTTDSNNSECIKGGVYKITYTYPITDQTVAAVSLNNKVTVESKDTKKGQTVTDDAESTVNVAKDFSYTLDKSGAVASDKPGYIKWTVTVNSNKVDIAGAKLTDEMLGLVENVSGDILIDPAEGATITENGDGKITDITFSGISGGVNKNQYTITYYTPVEDSWNGTTVTNKAILDPKPDQTGDEKEASASVIVSGVKLNKQGTFNGATNQIEWTITVNAGNLDIAGAKLTDEMFSALTGSDLTIEPTTGCKINKNENDKIKDIEFEAVEDGKNTQTYTIKYISDVTENEDGSIDPVTNTATLSPGEGKEGNPIGTESTVTPENVQLTKSGSYDWNGKINWTIIVNEGNRNIADAILTDDVFSELTPEDIVIRNGNWQEVSSESGEYLIVKNSSGKVASITFFSIGDTGVNTNKYVITYSTEALPEWEEKTVDNEVKLSVNGKDIPGNATVTVPADGSVSKSVGAAEISEDGTTATIPWTVTLTVPKGGLPAGTTIVDDVTKNQYGGTNTNQWMTRSQITHWATNLIWTDDSGNTLGGTNTYNPPPEQVTFLASNGNTYTYKQISEYNAPAGEGEVNFEALTYTLFTIHFPEELIPPEGATKLTFTYSTTAGLANTNVGSNKYYNDIKVGNKETSAEYTYYKPGVVKTDGNGNVNTTSISNDGTLTWKVKATVGEGNKKLTLIDTLPDDVTLDSLKLTGWGNLNMDLTIENSVISGTDSTNQYNVSGNIVGNSIILNIEPKTENSSIQTGAEFTLVITCKVTEAKNQTESKTLMNNVEMKLDDVEIGSSSQTQEWTYQATVDETKVVDKSGGWDNTNRIMNYTIVLNKDGETLLNDSDTLTLVDVMSYNSKVRFYHPFNGTYDINASLIQSSVKLYRAVWNAEQEEWEAGEVINDWSWTYETKAGENEWAETTNTITATGIPDGTPLMLQYAYRISSNVPDEVNGYKVSFDLKFNNKAVLEGTSHSGESSSSGKKWEYSSESAGVTTDKSYTFYKVEAGNYNVSLAGAVFSVYKYDTSSRGYEESPVKTYSTNDNGSFIITRQEKDNSGNVTFSYDTNTLYKVEETAPPKGYKLPDEVKTYYFYFSSSEDETNTLPADIPADAVDLSNEAKTVYVENVKNSTEISVEKQWQDQNGDPIIHNSGSVMVNLYQKTSQSSSSGEGTGGTGGDAVVTIDVKKAGYNNDSACKQETTISCKMGTIFTLNVSTWGTPKISMNNVELVYSSKEGTGPYAYIYSFTVNENVKISGNADDENAGQVTYTYQEPSIDSTPDESDQEETPVVPVGSCVGTTTLNSGNEWKHTFTDLPLTGRDEDGNAVIYYYYVEEVSVPNYETSYENNDGIQSGTITITNKATENPGVLLPETGGSGTIKYIMGGILLMLASVLLYIKQHLKEGRRKHIRR